MRVLRSSAYGSMRGDPLTTVVRDSDITDTLESAQHRVITPGAFIAFDLFEMPDGDIAQATAEALERMTDEVRWREQNQAISYHWNGDRLRLLTDSGLMFNDLPAPLTPDEVADVLGQLARHPNYSDGMTVRCVAEDGTIVELDAGRVHLPTDGS